jgi:hypothetical protein
MIFLFALLLFDNGQGLTADTQGRLDRLVNGCSATKVVRLTAESPREVLMTPLNAERAPTDDENTQFTCVLQGMQSMPDLKFGFLGNAAVGFEQGSVRLSRGFPSPIGRSVSAY